MVQYTFKVGFLSQPIPSGKDSKDLELCLLGDSMSSQVDSQDALLLDWLLLLLSGMLVFKWVCTPGSGLRLHLSSLPFSLQREEGGQTRQLQQSGQPSGLWLS